MEQNQKKLTTIYGFSIDFKSIKMMIAGKWATLFACFGIKLILKFLRELREALQKIEMAPK